MTRDDILNMQAGEEMDKRVAERIMKWKRAHLDYVFWQPSASEECLRYCSSVMPQTLRDFALFSPFHPSRDIADAWEVVGHLQKHYPAIDIYYSSPILTNLGWSVGLSGTQIVARGETPMLAICRAALLAVEDE